MARNERPGMRWLPGVVEEQVGPLTYRVQIESGQVWRRHVDHFRGLQLGSQGMVSNQDDHDTYLRSTQPIQNEYQYFEWN